MTELLTYHAQKTTMLLHSYGHEVIDYGDNAFQFRSHALRIEQVPQVWYSRAAKLALLSVNFCHCQLPHHVFDPLQVIGEVICHNQDVMQIRKWTRIIAKTEGRIANLILALPRHSKSSIIFGFTSVPEKKDWFEIWHGLRVCICSIINLPTADRHTVCFICLSHKSQNTAVITIQ